MRARVRIGSILLAAAVIGAGFAVPGSAAVAAGAVFVSESGSDGNPCSASKPYETITHALAVAGANSTIIVAPGTYHEDVVITQTARLLGQGHTVIDASGLDNGILVNGAKASRSTPGLYRRKCHLRRHSRHASQ